ncbi:hypothetical protein [uncultured Adlercreutzia sp.]|uniref:hypothetical protein n=1 Tax=uncultured Adlercreutzia sp. TaxID=875803 RepID=UPI0025DDB994|nr:hypothetical protein [uncultured Adlercreutzia sp.]
MVDVIYADSYGRELGYLPYAEGTFDVGVSNSFQLAVPAGLGIDEGHYLMIDGTDLGGRVDGLDIDTAADYVTAVGRTWSGLMATALVKPPAGQSHRTASGDLNAIIGEVIELLGLGYRMAAEEAPSGFEVSGWRFTREGEAMDGYSQLRALCRSVGAKLRFRYDAARRLCVVSAVARGDYADDGIDGDRTRFSISTRRPVNHLHCMGTGEGAARITVDLYADDRGRVSRTQTLFGPYHREEAYDNPGADEAELIEYGTQRLADYQADREKCSLPDAGDGRYDVDDMVGGTSTRHGKSVVTTVAQKTAVVDGETITYETKTAMEV